MDYVIYPLPLSNRAVCTEVSICRPRDDLWLSFCSTLFLQSLPTFAPVILAPEAPGHLFNRGVRGTSVQRACPGSSVKMGRRGTQEGREEKHALSSCDTAGTAHMPAIFLCLIEMFRFLENEHDSVM